MTGKKLDNLPRSDDDYWEEAQTYRSEPVRMPLCKSHSKSKWVHHKGYIDNHDGTASCKYCGWGFRIPGYIRIHEGKVFDLRKSKT